MTNRKKKKTAPKPSHNHTITKSYFDYYSSTAKKLLKLLKFEPDLFDEFTKKQKLKMMEVRILPPKVSAKYNHCVPRQYINYVKKEVNILLKEHFGDESLKLTYEDYLTVGMNFITQVLRIKKEQGENASEFVTEFAQLVNKIEEDISLVDSLLKFVQIQLFEVSKINIRIYGVDWGHEIESPKTFAGHIYITSTAPEVVSFTYHNKTRPAYRLAAGNLYGGDSIWFTVPHRSVVSGSNDEKPLKIYVQNHALLRVKERLDTMIPFNRNAAIMTSLVENTMVKSPKGQMLFSFIDAKKQLLGYMPFVVEGDSLFVLSFIPLSSPDAPEGSRLCKLLNITKDDMNFLGMDKLSFYQYTDFEAIPQLKAALIEAGMWHLAEIEPEERIPSRPFVKSAGVIAKFFQHNVPEPNKEEVFDEIEKLY